MAAVSLLSMALAAMIGVLLGIYAPGSSRPDPPESKPALALLVDKAHAPEADAPDAGVGDNASLSSVRPLRPTQAYAMAEPMPKSPFPGQKKPPCDPDYEISALGACWSVSFKKNPPCGTGSYDYSGFCVRAVFEASRQPSSVEP